MKAIATFDDGSTKDVTTDFAWTSSDPRTVGASSSGVLTGLASGKAMISGSYQSHQASVAASSALGDVQWSGPIVITRGGTYTGNWQSNDPQDYRQSRYQQLDLSSLKTLTSAVPPA